MFSALLVALCLMAGCGDKSTSTSTATTSGVDAAAATQAEAKPGDDLIAGEWCYDFQDESLHLTGVMEYDGKSKVSGTLYGDIQDKAEGYFTTYNTTFEGTRDGTKLTIQSTTEIENDVQKESETWTWDGKTLDNGRQKMKQVDCEPSHEGE